MKLTPEVCLRCGKPAWALFPLCLTWKSQNIVKICFLQISSLLNVEKTKDNDFSNLTLLLSSLHEVEKPNYDVLSNFPLFSKWKDKGELFFPASANGHPEGPASCKWWSRGTGFLQMVILRHRPLAKGYFYEGSIGDTRGWIEMTF